MNDRDFNMSDVEFARSYVSANDNGETSLIDIMRELHDLLLARGLTRSQDRDEIILMVIGELPGVVIVN